MLSNQEKINILNKILSTKEFKSSATYKKLLTYLVDASINNKKLKEYYLAVDVFEKGKDFNPSEDSSVRVYVSNLRKKLDHYYATEGKNDAYKIEIPKGHYDLNFVKAVPVNKKSDSEESNGKLTKILIPLLFVTGILAIYFGYHYFKYKETVINNEILMHPVWSNLIKDNKPLLITLGNDLFFLEKQDGEETIVRKHFINTTDEFKYYRKTHPDKKINKITPYYFFPAISVTELPILIQKINYPGKIYFKSTYECNGNDTKKYDVIFFGSFRNLHFWDFLLGKSSIKYSDNPTNLYLEVSAADTSIIFKQSGQPNKEHVDFCLFRKLPGPNNNTIYMFVSFFQPGLSAATNYMLDEKSLNRLTQKLKSKYGKLPEYFDVVFKTSGYSSTPFKTSIEYINKIDPLKTKLW